jgi:hypothetical protein
VITCAPSWWLPRRVDVIIFVSSFLQDSHRGRVAQLAEQLTLNQ